MAGQPGPYEKWHLAKGKCRECEASDLREFENVKRRGLLNYKVVSAAPVCGAFLLAMTMGKC